MTPPNDDAFVDGLIAEANPAGAGDAGKSAPVSSDPAAGGQQEQRPDNFSDEDYKTENDENFDPATVTAEQRKAWPKKYSNALSRRDKDNTRLKAENAALQQQLAQIKPKEAGAQPGAAAPTVKKAQENLDAQVDGKPDINDAKYTGDYGKYLEDVAEWKANVIAAKQIKAYADQQQQKTQAEQTTQATAQTEHRIATLAKQEIAKNPEILTIVQENADILDSYPPAILDVIGQLENPVIPLVHLAKTEGALEALGRMTPAQAAVTLGMAMAQAAAGSQNAGEDAEADAEAQHDAEPQAQPKKVSAAPQPMKAARAVNSGKKQLHQMDADEIFKELNL